MRRSAFSSRTGSVLRPAPNQIRRLGLGCEIGYTAARVDGNLRTIPVGWEDIGETKMAVDGDWNIVMTTPMGDRKATLSLKSAGGTLTGALAEGNSTEIFDGTTSGDDVAWKVSITNP